MPNLRIRPFEAADLEVLQRIRALAFAPVFRSFREIVGEPIARVAFDRADAEQAELLARTCAAQPDQQVHVAILADVIVGFVSLSLDRAKRIGEIGLNAVHPDHAGRGIGTALYRSALDEMRLAGMLVATVGVGGDASHGAARRAYEKAGFGPAVQSLWMYRTL
jgi:ribosomal protein S18 acetylase RimI-like enzyme